MNEIPPGKPPLELALAQEANDAIKSGADANAVTEKLHQVIGHLRANPDLAKQGQEALDAGIDASTIARKTFEHSLANPTPAAPQTPKSFSGQPEKAGDVQKFIDGATLGFGTKGMAGVDALADAVSSKVHGGSFSGTFGPAYEQNLTARNEALKQFDTAHPIESKIAGVTGAIAPVIATLGAGAGGAAATKAPLLARMVKAIPAGLGWGAANSIGHARGGPADYAKQVVSDAPLSAAGGFLAPAAGDLVGAGARAVGLPRLASATAQSIADAYPQSKIGRVMAQFAGATGTRGEAAEELGRRVEQDKAAGIDLKPPTPSVPSMAIDAGGPAVQGLAENIANAPTAGRSILTKKLTDRAALMRPNVEEAFNKGTGTTPESGEALLQNLATAHADLEQQMAAQQAARKTKVEPPSPLQYWRAHIGGSLSNGIQSLKQYVEERGNEAKQLFGAAREATRGQPMQSETLDQVMATPVGKQAYKWALSQKGNRNSPLATTEPTGAPPGIAPDDWANMKRLAEERNAQATAPKPVTASPDLVSGKKQDYTKLGNDDLLNLLREEQGVLEQNANKPQSWTRIDDYGNAISGGTLGGAIGRKQADFAAARLNAIEAELKHRGIDEDLIQESRFSSPDAPLTRPGGPAPFQIPEVAGGGQEAPDPETLHYMKQYLAKLSRLGMNDGAQGTVATQAQGALQAWGKIRSEMPEVWQQADEAFAKKSRVIDALNTGRNVMRTQLNPAGMKALHQSMDAIEQKMVDASPEEQHAFRIGAQSAVTDYLRSGNVSAKALAAQLAEPSSAMARRFIMATGDANAPTQLADQMMPRARPPLQPPQLSPEMQAASRGLDITKHSVSPPASAPERSLAVLDRDAAQMDPADRQALQQGAAQAFRGEFAGAKSLASPGRVFMGGSEPSNYSPERLRQLGYAFPTPEAASQFQRVASAWDAIAGLNQKVLKGSPTAPRMAEESARQGPSGNALLSAAGGNVGSALKQILQRFGNSASSAQRGRVDTELASRLTAPDMKALIDAITAMQSRRAIRGSVQRALPAVGGLAASGTPQ